MAVSSERDASSVDEALLALADPGDPGAVAEAFAQLVDRGDDVPAPGSGRTWQRLAYLARVAAASPALARLIEGHHDARAILAELEHAGSPGARLGVWAAEPGGVALAAERDGDGWRVTGQKPYASGADSLSHALVTAREAEQRLLFLLPASVWRAVPGTWQAVGMSGSDSPTVEIATRLPAAALVGAPGAYLARPGFWHGGVGVAAVWHGGAVGVAAALRRREPAAMSHHAAAHLGAVEAALAGSDCVLRAAAAAIDADPYDLLADGQRRARTVRAVVEAAATATLDHVGRALGAGPLCHDRAHARRVADLTVYLRQSHAESDLEALGRLVAHG